MSNRDRVTLRHIAELTNKSVNTVSRVLNAKDGVGAETEELIKRTAAELNYRPNLMARGIRTQKSNLIGMLVQDISNHFFNQLMVAAQAEAAKARMNLLICSSDRSPEKELEHIDTFVSYNCAGMALNLVSPTVDLIERLKGEDRNMIILDAPEMAEIDCPAISVSNEQDSFAVVEYLLRLGHRRVAIVNSRLTTATMTERYSGYQRALKKYAVAEEPALMCTCRDTEDAYQMATRLATQDYPPSAIYIANEALGLSVIAGIANAGLRIPEDISVAIFGEPEWATVFRPRITCMQRPVLEMGRIGVRMLLDEISGRKTRENNGRLTLSSRLMIRESVKATG